ncbi:MAG: rod shape-determining protein MreC [Bryobacteraceae bacterium]
MEFLFNRYRNLTVLLVTIVAQLVLLAYQVKGNGEVRLIRIWAVTAVTPIARGIEAARAGTAHFFNDYFVLLDVREENKRMKAELDRIHMENQYLRTELDTADRAKSLAIFQQTSPSKTVAAHIIGNATGPSGKVALIDRGATSGVEKGMAVITPDGIVGKVVDAYPVSSFVLLATDPTFAAGVISQKNRVHGTLKGTGGSKVMVDYVQNEEKVDEGEWFYTSGDDGIFPKGLPAGQVTSVHPGKKEKEIYLDPSGFQNGLEEVLIVVEGVHAPIPDAPPPDQTVHLLAPPPPDASAAPTPPLTGPLSDADRILEKYKAIGDAEKHVYGDRGTGAPNYNIAVPAAKPDIAKPDIAKPGAAKPPEPKPSDPKPSNP